LTVPDQLSVLRVLVGLPAGIFSKPNFEITLHVITGNQFGDHNSNVVRLYTCLEVNREQVAYYHPGVGTMGAPNKTTRIGKKISQAFGLAVGRGFRNNLEDAYRFLMENYADGDRVYLFGFSRGVYTVRALTGALSLYGLLCPGNDGHLTYLLQMFSEASRKAFAEQRTRLADNPIATAFKETFSRDLPIHFIGIWDTVSSIGWIYDPVKLLFDGQNPLIRKGRHAISVYPSAYLSLDETVNGAKPRNTVERGRDRAVGKGRLVTATGQRHGRESRIYTRYSPELANNRFHQCPTASANRIVIDEIT
jgi:Uncharacterized alpha/beta hydrolase domain (DUF2235)